MANFNYTKNRSEALEGFGIDLRDVLVQGFTESGYYAPIRDGFGQRVAGQDMQLMRKWVSFTPEQSVVIAEATDADIAASQDIKPGDTIE